MGDIKRSKRIICGSIALAAVAVFGFMGVQKFSPNERSLRIINDRSVMTAADAVENDEVKNSTSLNIDAKAAILIDGSSGRVLYAQDAKKHLPPASVTKVMTLLLIMEGCESGKISLDDQVVVSERAADMGGSQMYMEMGETHSVEELLKGVIMVSANDGCVALAEHLSGSVEAFVDDMNKRAKKMGLNDSNFINTNGLPVTDHYSCAYDIGMISYELMKHEYAQKWFTTWQEDIKVGLPGKERKFTLTNTNKLIKTYNGAIGVKTGYTDDAGYCLSGAAERDGSRMIGVVLGCKTSDIRFKEMGRLLDHGFAKYETVELVKQNEKVKKIDIEKGTCDKIYAVAENPIKLTVERGMAEKVTKEATVKKNIKLPIKKGDVVGELTVYENDKSKHTYDLVSDRDVSKAGFVTQYIRLIKKLI